MTIEKKLKTEALVEQILREDQRARDDDLWLTYRVYQKLTRVFIPFEDFARLPRPETISRARRKIQNDKGLYPPSPEARNRRRKNINEVVEWTKM